MAEMRKFFVLVGISGPYSAEALCSLTSFSIGNHLLKTGQTVV